MADNFNWSKVLGDKADEKARPAHLGPQPLSAEDLSALDEFETPPVAKKSVFDSIPPREPAEAETERVPMRGRRAEDDGPVIDPRTGELMTEPMPARTSVPDRADAAAHNKYKPAGIVQSVHDI